MVIKKGNFKKGHFVSEETRKKIGDANRGRKLNLNAEQIKKLKERAKNNIKWESVLLKEWQCKSCKKIFFISLKNVKYFCSKKCSNKYNGKKYIVWNKNLKNMFHHSEKTKKIIDQVVKKD